MKPTFRNVFAVPSAVIVVAAVLAAPAVAGPSEVVSFASEELVVENVIGEIRVEGHDGSEFEVEISIQGRDATAENVRVESAQGRKGRLSVRFPVERKTTFVYPRMGSGSSTTFDSGTSGDSWIARVLDGSRKRITVRGSGSGLEVWADATVRVPRGKSLRLRHGVGEVEATGVDGPLSVDLRSGGVRVARQRGDLSVDTGSGHVEVRGAEGEIRIDTGSGRVVLSDTSGRSVEVDTGSGRVEVDTVACDSLSVDTGSGSVEVRGLRAADISIDTGSGSVQLELAEVGAGEIDVDTGSGSITLLVPPGASADVEAETGAGAIRVGLDDIRVVRQERDELEFRVGGGAAKVRLETGSGSIRIDRS